MLGMTVLIAAAILALPLFQLCRKGDLLVASLIDLQNAITDNTAAVNALTAASGNAQPHDFQPEVDAIAANTAAVNAVTAQLQPPQ